MNKLQTPGLFLPLAAGLLIFAAGHTFGQADVIKIETKLVMVPVTMTDKKGKHLPDLRQENFKIYEDAVEQQIDFFKSGDYPVTVLILLDTSGSMRPYIDSLANAATLFIQHLRPNDHIMIGTFARTVDEVLPETEVKGLKGRLQIRANGDATYIYDAVDYALKRLHSTSGRKAIILFTDGLSEKGRISAEQNLRDAEKTEAVIYTIRFGALHLASISVSGPYGARNIEMEEKLGTKIQQADKSVDSYMKGLAEKTAGRAFHLAEIKNLDKTYAEILRELNHQYSLGYYPVAPGKTGERRKISVHVDVPGVIIRARPDVVYSQK